MSIHPGPHGGPTATRNMHPEWVGIDELIRLQREYLTAHDQSFEDEVAFPAVWDDSREYPQRGHGHRSGPHAMFWTTGMHEINGHYDCWLFPVDRHSLMRFKYTVYAEEVQSLREVPGYVDNLRRLVNLWCFGYGWDLPGHRELGDVDGDEPSSWVLLNALRDRYDSVFWQRLGHITRSMQLFELEDEFQSLLAFRRLLVGYSVRKHDPHLWGM